MPRLSDEMQESPPTPPADAAFELCRTRGHQAVSRMFEVLQWDPREVQQPPYERVSCDGCGAWITVEFARKETPPQVLARLKSRGIELRPHPDAEWNPTWQPEADRLTAERAQREAERQRLERLPSRPARPADDQTPTRLDRLEAQQAEILAAIKALGKKGAGDAK
jgi:hypothetical protein